MYSKVVLVAILLFSFFYSEAQEIYSISGIVKDASGETLPAATIFLDGSEKKTYTNDKGEFILGKLSPGTYELTAHFVGYKASRKNVIIKDKSVVVNLTMEVAEHSLKEVVITNSKSRNKYIELFLKSFLGDTENGKSCYIVNPEIIRFSEQLMHVTAKTSDFLEIENRNLGYRIKYLLRDFKFNRSTLIASYTGECIFENLKGTTDEMNIWNKNRREAYYGSLMHYLRSIYANTADKEGFHSYAIKNAKKETQQIDTRQLSVQNIAKPIDSNFLEMEFSEPLYVFYDFHKDQSSAGTLTDEERITKAFNEKTGSIMELYLKKATIDAKGSIVDYRSFLIKGYWGERRIGDQLPFEYVPDEGK
jgi:hypothetical protein